MWWVGAWGRDLGPSAWGGMVKSPELGPIPPPPPHPLPEEQPALTLPLTPQVLPTRTWH